MHFEQVAKHASLMFSGAVSMALPTVIALLIVNITFAIMVRSAPQLNIFTIGFPITLILGFTVMFLTFNGVMVDMQSYFQSGFAAIHQLIGMK